jgi:uncharacterized protein YdiU (UPF0061 family)
MRLGFEHSYAALPPRFLERVRPTAVTQPGLVVLNAPLAAQLGLDPDTLEPRAAALFSGNELPEDAEPLAMAYAGHQFGNFVPQLGDGRAILLGELRGPDGMLRDLQLKGGGRTRYSRGGDGRAALGPMLREYLVSEAMHALGIPTTRSLAVVTTGERVLRDTGPLPGAVLARVAASHVRVGTFEYFAARGDDDGVRTLLDYVIARHYPEARAAALPALALLAAVVERQAALLADWMRVGFIHGVMNTDNMAISGETIDYGPCAFMDHYDSRKVFSSIDRGGRYAYANQPRIAQWNLARFAETLLPLLDPDGETAVRLATDELQRFEARCDAHLLTAIRRKLGLATEEQGDGALVSGLLACLQEGSVDFTLAFRRLCDVAGADAAESPAWAALRALFPVESALDAWLEEWRARVAHEARSPVERAAAMRRVNPAYIARNHRVEAALQAATGSGDFGPFRTLLDIVQHPWDERPGQLGFMQPPEPAECVLQTFCGT